MMRGPTIGARVRTKKPADLPDFAPGDLITAEMLNRLVAALRSLEDRIAALEGRTG